MSVAQRDIIALAPEFSALEPDVIQQAITDATAICSPSFWDVQLNLAVRYLAAHFLAEQNPSSQPAVVREETVGPITRAYAVGTAMENEELASTRYGRRYLELLHSNPASHMMVI